MDGEAGVDSMPHVGSNFWFTARLKKDTAALKTQVALTIDAERLVKLHHAGKRILVVDDEPINQMVAQMQLEAADLVVEIAGDGVEAINLIKQSSYDAILMDMQMPNLNGLDTTRMIREMSGYQDIPIIAMIANAFVEDKTQCLAAGMNDFLIKPYDSETLFATLLCWLNG